MLREGNEFDQDFTPFMENESLGDNDSGSRVSFVVGDREVGVGNEAVTQTSSSVSQNSEGKHTMESDLRHRSTRISPTISPITTVPYALLFFPTAVTRDEVIQHLASKTLTVLDILRDYVNTSNEYVDL
uniref:Uncharacterized protein n=1 Tax=Lygus hesperus TaxID=30085 RepID=A0A146M428_LYGHE